MADTLDTSDTPRYLTDAQGNRTHVVMTIEAYEELVEEAWHRRVVAERRGGETISLGDLKERLGL